MLHSNQHTGKQPAVALEAEAEAVGAAICAYAMSNLCVAPPSLPLEVCQGKDGTCTMQLHHMCQAQVEFDNDLGDIPMSKLCIECLRELAGESWPSSPSPTKRPCSSAAPSSSTPASDMAADAATDAADTLAGMSSLAASGGQHSPSPAAAAAAASSVCSGSGGKASSSSTPASSVGASAAADDDFISEDIEAVSLLFDEVSAPLHLRSMTT